MPSTKAKIITNQTELRANKLKNKRTQLENLLRSRERIDFEIKNLKKSINRDLKQHLKESEMYYELSEKGFQEESLREAIVLDEGADPESELRKFIKNLKLTDDEIHLIIRILLAFAETL